MTLLNVDNVAVRFDGVTAVDGVSFFVDEAELLGLIGPNGAGKTTLMRAVTGVVAPASGSVSLNGRELTRLPIHRRVRLGIGLSQQLVKPFTAMTVAENVMLAAGYARTARPWSALLRVRRSAERERAVQLLKLVGIADAIDAQPAGLPLGYLKRLEVARALALNPRLLLLDEPLAGLNHIEAAQLADTIADLNRQGVTMILIEHNLGEVMRICSRLLVLDNGVKIGEGDPRQVMAEPRIRAAYLGSSV